MPVGFKGAPIGSDDDTGANRGPPHTVNPILRAGDIVIMSECTTHGVLPWCSEGHRHVVKMNFCTDRHPEDAMTPEEIIRLPPELRELRSYTPTGHVKAIASATGPITLCATHHYLSLAPRTPHRSKPACASQLPNASRWSRSQH